MHQRVITTITHQHVITRQSKTYVTAPHFTANANKFASIVLAVSAEGLLVWSFS